MVTIIESSNVEKLMKVKANVIELHLTNLCNHACSWCVADEVRQNKWQFTLEGAKKLMREMAESGVEKVIFSGGGDPLLFKGIEEVLELSHSLGMSNLLINNGFGLKEKNIPLLARTCEFIRISLDSGNRETHTAIHRPKNEKVDNFDVITNNISNLMKEIKENNLSTRVVLTFVVVDESIGSIPDFIRLANRLGVDEIEFKTNHFWSADRKLEVYEKIQKFTKELPNQQVKISLEYPKSRAGEKSETEWNAFLLTAVIEANGAIYPCCHKSLQPNWYLGNAVESSFQEAWISADRRKVLERIIKEKEVCTTCTDGNYNKLVNRFVSKHGWNTLLKD